MNIEKIQQKLLAAQQCHPNAVQTLIAEALEAITAPALANTAPAAINSVAVAWRAAEMTTNQDRAAFEAWVLGNGAHPRRPDLKSEDGSYHYKHTEHEWTVWKSALQAHDFAAWAAAEKIHAFWVHHDHRPRTAGAGAVGGVDIQKN